MPSQPETLAEAIGRRLTACREGAEKSRADVARDAELSAAYVTQLEQGQREPSVRVLLRLAGAVGCRPCELLRDGVGDAA